jgi:hypothetical protein
MRSGRSLVPLVVVLLLACACSLDRRRLREATGGSSSSPSANGAAAGEPEPGNTGSGGTGSTPKGLVDGCADLDTDGVGDCTTTLVENASFTEDVDGWQPRGDTDLTWQDKNALEDLPSGSARLTAETARASAEQCVKLPGRQLVIAYASVFVEDDSELGQAVLQVSFFENQDCDGELSAYFETPPSTVTNSWSTIQAGAVSPPGTASVSVALVGVKPDEAEQIEVYFDNVMLKAKELM